MECDVNINYTFKKTTETTSFNCYSLKGERTREEKLAFIHER